MSELREFQIIDLLETASRQIEHICICYRSSDLTAGDRNALMQLDLVVNSIKPLDLLRHSIVDASRLIGNIEYCLFSSRFDIRRPGEIVEKLDLHQGRNVSSVEVICSTSNILTCMKELREILMRENNCGQDLDYQSTFSDSEYAVLSEMEEHIEVNVQCYRTSESLSDDCRKYFDSNTVDEIQETRNRLIEEYHEMQRHNKALSRKWIQETLRLVACALISLSTDSSTYHDLENGLKDLREFSKMLLSFKLSELLIYSKEILPYLNDVIAALDYSNDISSMEEISNLLEVVNQLAHICAKQVTKETRGSIKTFCCIVEVNRGRKLLTPNKISDDSKADWVMKFQNYHDKQDIISKWDEPICPVCLEDKKLLNEKGADWAVFANCVHLLCVSCFVGVMKKMRSE